MSEETLTLLLAIGFGIPLAVGFWCLGAMMIYCVYRLLKGDDV